MRKQHRKPTIADHHMGTRFRDLRLRLRPDLARHQAFGDALRPPVTAQTIRNWEHGRPIPDKAKRAIGALIGCELIDFYPKSGAMATEEHLLLLRSDAETGLLHNIWIMLEASNGRELIERWAQQYQELGDQETADFIRSEAKRAAKDMEEISPLLRRRPSKEAIDAVIRAVFSSEDENDNGNNQTA